MLLLVHIFFTTYLLGTFVNRSDHRWKTIAASLTLYLGFCQTFILFSIHFPVFMIVWIRQNNDTYLSFDDTYLSFDFSDIAAFLGPVTLGLVGVFLNRLIYR